MDSNLIEKSILGLILNNPELGKIVRRQLPIEYFGIQEPWEHIYEIIDSGKRPSLSMAIEATDHERYLNECADLYNAVASLQTLVERQIEVHRERIAESMIKEYISERGNVDQLILSLKEVQKIGIVKDDNWASDIQKAVDGILRAAEFGASGHKLFGIDELDNYLNGGEAGDLIIVAASTGTGKSVMCSTIVNQMSVKSNFRGLYWSLEMTKEQLIQRQLASLGSHTFSQIRAGQNINEEELLKAGARLFETNIKITEKSGVDVNYIVGEIIRQHAIKPLDYVMIDHGGWIKLAKGNANTSEKKGQITKTLKSLAKELGIPIILLWQFNRGVSKRPDQRPMVSDLRDSGEVEEDADKILLLWRPAHHDILDDPEGNPYPPNYGEIEVAKCRGGRTGIVKAQMDMDVVLWKDLVDPIFDKKAIPILAPSNGYPSADGRIELRRDIDANDTPFA